ncbi:MAG TPA: ArgR family transcriptional regulator [Paludibacteraceae bacterium]|jgi:transcriptional regulator of arginine metabolism|nr:ArgR family transcriptional regulator [Paludibacteraceae bacterium]HPS11158.1 ArgR family transcriptional regulator [Paludibacteraceae bacterium]
MKNKRERLGIISEILRMQVIGSQEELLDILRAKGYDVTQATLSRDLKVLKVAKTPLSNGAYKYVLPPQIKPISDELNAHNFTSHGAVLNLEFSGQLAVLKTKPGYASAIAWDIDNRSNDEVLGTIAGDDTILLIPREGVTRADITKMINMIFQEKS